MNQLRYTLPFILFASAIHCSEREQYNIILEPMWHNLDAHTKKHGQLEGKWILVGSITFKKHSKEFISLNRMNFHWQGKPLEHLVGSLYKKLPDKNFMAIEDNLICDGYWNKVQQKLILNFDHKQTLGPTTIFYLVLTVPENVEPTLHHGKLSIEKKTLPEPFKQAVDQKQLTLALSTVGLQEIPLS